MCSWVKGLWTSLQPKVQPRDPVLEQSRHDLNKVTDAQTVLTARFRQIADEFERLRHD